MDEGIWVKKTCRTRQVRDGEEASLMAWHKGFPGSRCCVLPQLPHSLTESGIGHTGHSLVAVWDGRAGSSAFLPSGRLMMSGELHSCLTMKCTERGDNVNVTPRSLISASGKLINV